MCGEENLPADGVGRAASWAWGGGKKWIVWCCPSFHDQPFYEHKRDSDWIAGLKLSLFLWPSWGNLNLLDFSGTGKNCQWASPLVYRGDQTLCPEDQPEWHCPGDIEGFSCLTLCDPMDCSMPGFPVLHCLLEFPQTHIHWVIDAIQPSHPLLPLLLLPSISPSIRVFSNKSALCIRWLKYWSFSFSISSSNEYSGLISFRIDKFDILAIQKTLKRLLQHSLKAIVLWCSAFFIVQLSHPHMTAGKNHSFDYSDLCEQSDVCFFNTLSRLVISFLPKSKHLLISWLQSPSAGILEPR